MATVLPTTPTAQSRGKRCMGAPKHGREEHGADKVLAARRAVR
eukprot:CAMPEP_0183444426 /NCGR_PEP_ID=MMETSP0370-20130417/95002_1 /TAXON_ID=268820 /ORGANISM="Peridinium aciculiferum, Strain PAER-2" /LENGTH=42 /DNA_ID= /DNA_START= /DNA_END= /DNA_ORIENTATION=